MQAWRDIFFNNMLNWRDIAISMITAAVVLPAGLLIFKKLDSIAIHTSPEVLLIDEILAVGDESFQKKSGKALLDLIKGGVTTVYVSHSMEAVKKPATGPSGWSRARCGRKAKRGRLLRST